MSVLPVGPWVGPQGVTRYGCSVNADGKIHPDRIRRESSWNYV